MNHLTTKKEVLPPKISIPIKICRTDACDRITTLIEATTIFEKEEVSNYKY
jgi:hypothetical protein